MHVIIEMIAALVAMMAAMVLSPLGVEMRQASPEREVHRVSDCKGSPDQVRVAPKKTEDC